MEIRRRLGDCGGLAHTETFLGRIAVAMDNLPEAVSHYHEALALRQQTGETEGMIAPLEGLAAVASASGDPRRAARLLGAASALRTRLGAPLPPTDSRFYDHILGAVRRQLSPPSFAREWQSGESLPLERVVAEAGSVSTARTVPDEQPGGSTKPTNERASMAAVTIVGLGMPRVLRAGRELGAGDWTYTKARELLFYLLVQGASTKGQIGLALWPDASAAQLRTTFHPSLYHLRRALGGSAWILLDQQRYALNRTMPYTFDVEQFTEAIAQANRCAATDPDEAISLLRGAIARYTGEFLADSTEGEWFLPIQDRLHRSFLDALQQLGALCYAAAHYADAADAYKRAIAADAYLEWAHRELMRCYARLDERGLALRHFRIFAGMLGDELGTSPGQTTRMLFEHLRRGEEIE